MSFKLGDRVEHVDHGKGTFLGYGLFRGEGIVKFDPIIGVGERTFVVQVSRLSKLNEERRQVFNK